MKGVLTVLSGIFILVILVEGIFRTIQWQPSINGVSIPKVLTQHVGASPRFQFNVSGLSDGIADIDTVIINNKHYPYHLKTNAAGFRANAEYDPNKSLILILGRSLVMGAGISNADTFAEWLFADLKKRNFAVDKLQIMNMGHPGYGLTSTLEYLKDKGRRMAPKIVLLGIMLSSVMTEVKKGKPSLRSIYQSDPTYSGLLARFRTTVGPNSAVYNFFTRLRRASLNFEKMKQKHLSDVPGIDHIRPVDTQLKLNQVVYDPERQSSRPYWNNFRKLIRAHVEALKPTRTTLALILFPDIIQIADPSFPVTPQSELKKVCSDVGAVCIDLLPTLRDVINLEPIYLLHSPPRPNDTEVYTYTYEFPKFAELVVSGDAHFSRYGHYLIANTIADAIVKHELLSDLDQ